MIAVLETLYVCLTYLKSECKYRITKNNGSVNIGSEKQKL